ncbi:MAG: hypothetical protein CMF38_05375 [Legionellaceae bacterium]|nr:hypothetical protein [Legionellaceae bacterium]HAF86932.1 hypothetical protein [Legionellales bacterium]|tara:strand:- start:2518 stop:3207 length:690 start_codon:yes stop_codon:yes gene_type:complete
MAASDSTPASDKTPTPDNASDKTNDLIKGMSEKITALEKKSPQKDTSNDKKSDEDPYTKLLWDALKFSLELHYNMIKFAVEKIKDISSDEKKQKEAFFTKAKELRDSAQTDEQHQLLDETFADMRANRSTQTYEQRMARLDDISDTFAKEQQATNTTTATTTARSKADDNAEPEIALSPADDTPTDAMQASMSDKQVLTTLKQLETKQDTADKSTPAVDDEASYGVKTP